MWRVDQTLVLADGHEDSPMSIAASLPSSSRHTSPTLRGSSMSDSGSSTSSAGDDDLRAKVMRSGALSLAGAGITLMSDTSCLGRVSKARIPFVRDGGVEKLVVNVLMSVFVP